MAGESVCPHSPDTAQITLSSVFHKVELIHKCSIAPSCKWRAAVCCCAARMRPDIALCSTDCVQISGGEDLRLSLNHLLSFCVYKIVCVFYEHESS